MFLLRMMFAPLTWVLSLFIWVCIGMISCSTFIFKLASGLLSLLAFAVMFTCSVKNGFILLFMAFLVSPMGIPMITVWLLEKLQTVNSALQNIGR